MVGDELKVSHTGGPGTWVGLIKRGEEIVWRCPHGHRNRDCDTRSTAARTCASLVLKALTDPAYAREFIGKLERCAPHFQYAWQAQQWRHTIERHRWALSIADEIRNR